MTVTEEDLNQLRTDMTERLTAVSVDVMGALTALSDHVDRFNRLEARFDRVDTRIDTIDAKFDARFDKLNDRFSEVNSRFDRVDAKIEQLNNKLDHRFSWQTVIMTALALLALFGDQLRAVLGL